MADNKPAYEVSTYFCRKHASMRLGAGLLGGGVVVFSERQEFFETKSYRRAEKQPGATLAKTGEIGNREWHFLNPRQFSDLSGFCVNNSFTILDQGALKLVGIK